MTDVGRRRRTISLPIGGLGVLVVGHGVRVVSEPDTVLHVTGAAFALVLLWIGDGLPGGEP